MSGIGMIFWKTRGPVKGRSKSTLAVTAVRTQSEGWSCSQEVVRLSGTVTEA